MSLTDEKSPKQEVAKKASLRSASAHLLAVGRSLSCPEVIILRTSDGTLLLTATAALWQDLGALIARRPPAQPWGTGAGRPKGTFSRGPAGRGSSLSPERLAALHAQIAACKAGQSTHQQSADLLGMSRSCFSKWFERLPAPAATPAP